MSNRFVYIVVLLGLSHSFHHLMFANGHPVEYWACYLPSVVRREPMFQRDMNVSKSRCYSQTTKSIVFMSLHFYSSRFIYLQCTVFARDPDHNCFRFSYIRSVKHATQFIAFIKSVDLFYLTDSGFQRQVWYQSHNTCHSAKNRSASMPFHSLQNETGEQGYKRQI